MSLKKLSAMSMSFLVSAALAAGGQVRVEFKTIDGVPHAFNSALPLKGTVKLEIEKTRTIDPYERPEVGMKSVDFARRENGEVVLFDANQSEGHRFAPDGKYLGFLSKKGQGPGEFGPWSIYQVYFHGSDIWVFGGSKVARFDEKGKFLAERKLKRRCSLSLAPGFFLAEEPIQDDPKLPTVILSLVKFAMNGEEAGLELLRDKGIGAIRRPDGRGGFSEPWGTPNFFYSSAFEMDRIYCGLNTKYRICVKDFSGQDILVIQREYENIKVKRSDLGKILSWAAKSENLKWIFSAYPDQFVALRDVKAWPKGYFAAYRVCGPQLFEIDVFNPKGEYLYALIPPAGVNFEKATFFSSGFGTVESVEDSFVYCEYRIKNLPEIFGK
jgi:hypothetical protein